VDVVAGKRAEAVQRKPQDGDEEAEGRTGVDAEGAEERRVSSAEGGERHTTGRTGKSVSQ